MIFLTVGTQLPFDRLTMALDRLAPILGLTIFGQIGRSTYVPRNFPAAVSMRPGEFEQRFAEADLIVAHAGIGTVLKAQQMHKPLILFPRRAAFGEHRNDHQLATCAQLRGKPGVHVAEDEAGLEVLLMSHRSLGIAGAEAETESRTSLIENLRSYFEAA